MTNLTTDSIRKADIYTLFGALETALKEVHTAGPKERTACLALATQINDEINRRA